MTSRAITNSLLRIDGVTGTPPPPFERPNDNIDFFVLELGRDSDMAAWCARTLQTLSTHSVPLRKMLGRAAKATLFVESAAGVLRFEPPFLRILADAGIALECSHVNA